jgi:hypothetical protein
VDVAKQAGTEVVAVAGRGEPLMDPNFWRLGEMVREHGLEFLVFTNGTLVTPETAKRLKETCTTVITKLFAMEPKAHDALVGIKGEFRKTRQALVHLLEAGMRGPNLAVDLVITKQNEKDLVNILRMCRMLGVIPYFERFAPIGRGEKLNGNVVFTPQEVTAVFTKLREIDETEFGITWGITDDMPALAHAETDKRMVAVHVDVFGDVQPGLETGRVMGNIRDTEGGLAGIFADAKPWGEFFKETAEEVGLERIGHGAAGKEGYREILADVVHDAGRLCREHTEGCAYAAKKGEVPEDVRRMAGRMGEALDGSGYEAIFKDIRMMVLDERHYARMAGELLLMELVYGNRHREHCRWEDLQRHEWEAWGVDAHLAHDPVWKAFMEAGGMQAINDDYIEACCTFEMQLLELFAGRRLEFATTNLIKWAVPKERSEGNKEKAGRFENALMGAEGMPIMWNLAYEHTAGRKDIPRNRAFLDATIRLAGENLIHIHDSMGDGRGPREWLGQNTACLFVGANDLASLAGFIYNEGKAREAALGTLRAMCRDTVLRRKIMMKKGLPRNLL